MTSSDNSKFKKILYCALAVVFAAAFVICFYSPVIFQEGNAWPQIKGIVQLNLGNKDMVKLAIGENKYIAKSDDPEAVKTFMKEQGYDFIEQMGSGYLFRSRNGAGAVATHRYYSRFYSLWSITENPKTGNTNLAEKLRECLPKSDMASREVCTELLRGIADYSTCVRAGFSIMKSNPSQCATPDGRIFIEDR